MADYAKGRIIEPQEIETQVFDWGRIKWLSEPRVTAAEKFSAGVILLAPGKGHTAHTHPGVEEILYFIAGKGEQMIAGERKDVGPGSLAHIPPDVEHETINTGWDEMKILAIYAPPGPEAMLRGLPECEVLPPGE